MEITQNNILLFAYEKGVCRQIKLSDDEYLLIMTTLSAINEVNPLKLGMELPIRFEVAE